MKFGQLIEYNMRNIFVEKSYTKYGRETISRPFPKKSKLLIKGPSKYSETKLQNTCFYLYNAFLKNKKRSGTSLSASFSA